ncbi:MAG TPA: tRNA (N6-isopentenyl adenosine(37)-C2)-methylthiotransferase MiaB, partial [Aquificae bacterium]|nr:tRNA (N6-isopentenyl adenosine(37)-C2)-methylthiotransferase MiaB [Aquificota bacterium]
MKTFFIKVFGCQMNEYDSLKVKSILESLNLKEVKDPYQADIILVDTCTVREKPENKALSF